MIAGRISDDDYQKKHLSLKTKQSEITDKLRKYDSADTRFSNHLEYLIKVAYGAADFFSGSKKDRKRDIMKYVFSNLELRGQALEYKTIFPFDEFAKYRKNGEWLGWEDSNLRITGSKPVALPLGYTPIQVDVFSLEDFLRFYYSIVYKY